MIPQIEFIDEGVLDLGLFAEDAIRALGGPGSGFFGHAGRPGEVGGSADAGSASGFPKGTRRQSPGMSVVQDRTREKLNLYYKVGEEALRRYIKIKKVDQEEKEGTLTKERADELRMLKSVYDYKNGGPIPTGLNNALRDGKKLTYEQQLIMDAYDRVETPLPPGIFLYRGIHADAYDFDKLAVGKRVTMKGLISTSAEPKVALNFADKKNPILFEIKTTRGSRGAYFGGLARNSFLSYEKEVVLAHKSSFKIVGMTRNKDGVRFVQLEMQ